MKVLLIKPMEHPQVVDIENSLKEFYRILDCDCITATYPWEERAALVTDDNGLFTEKPFSRYIPELEQPIKVSSRKIKFLSPAQKQRIIISVP